MTEGNTRQIQLNEYQRAAVLDDSLACVVNANVGSGKTTVLIEKILYLHLERHVPLEQMIVLTFTNKAADEITERLLRREPGIRPEQVEGFGTFHSVALRLLKNRLPVENAGWTKEFTIMDPDEETDLALDIIAGQGLKVKYKNRLKKRMEQEYQTYLSGKTESRYKDDLFRLYPLLLEEKKRQNKMSFADLLRVASELLSDGTTEEEHREASPESGKGWRPAWIIVDEVQDSDSLQLEFLAALRDFGRTETPGKGGREKPGGENAPENHTFSGAKLFAVGDPNQVIYSWRGTGENMFFRLKHRFAARELSLPVNYRSDVSILEAANRFMQFGEKIRGSRQETGRIVVKNHYDPFQEAEYLADRIRSLHEDGESYSGIAVFYRLQRQAEVLTKVFERQGIPFELSVKRTLKDIPVLEWLLKVLRFSVNSADIQSAVNVLADPRYGGKCTKKKAMEIVRGDGRNKGKDSRETEEGGRKESGPEKLFRRMREFPEYFAGRAESPSAEELFAYFGLREALHPASEGYAGDEHAVMDFLKKMCGACSGGGAAEAGGNEARQTQYAEQKDFAERIREFVNSSALYGMKTDAGEKAADGEDMLPPGRGSDTADRVKLMTLHASKGLEFDVVFMIGVNQGLIPLRCRSFEQEEEERRLFFVGITRAKRMLELSWYTNPGEPGALGEPGRYLQMIPQHLMKREDIRSHEEKHSNLRRMRREVQEQIRKRRTGENIGEAGAERKGTDTGQAADEREKVIHVRHKKYGNGVLISEDEMNVEVEFPGYGRKKFLKAFGEVERI